MFDEIVSIQLLNVNRRRALISYLIGKVKAYKTHRIHTNIEKEKNWTNVILLKNFDYLRITPFPLYSKYKRLEYLWMFQYSRTDSIYSLKRNPIRGNHLMNLGLYLNAVTYYPLVIVY